MTSRDITYSLGLRKVKKSVQAPCSYQFLACLSNLRTFYFPRSICGQRYLCTAVRVKSKVYRACVFLSYKQHGRSDGGSRVVVQDSHCCLFPGYKMRLYELGNMLSCLAHQLYTCQLLRLRVDL